MKCSPAVLQLDASIVLVWCLRVMPTCGVHMRSMHMLRTCKASRMLALMRDSLLAGQQPRSRRRAAQYWHSALRQRGAGGQVCAQAPIVRTQSLACCAFFVLCTRIGYSPCTQDMPRALHALRTRCVVSLLTTLALLTDLALSTTLALLTVHNFRCAARRERRCHS